MTKEQIWCAQIANRTEANEEVWLINQANSLLTPNYPFPQPPNDKPTLLPSNVFRKPEMPVTPPTALTQEVDPSHFRTLREWKRRMDEAPWDVQRDAKSTESVALSE
eukprot:4387027-Amphidinium_carterae.1